MKDVYWNPAHFLEDIDAGWYKSGVTKFPRGDIERKPSCHCARWNTKPNTMEAAFASPLLPKEAALPYKRKLRATLWGCV